MLKRIKWRLVGYGFIWMISLAGLFASMSFINLKKGETSYSDLKVIIEGSNNFIEREEVDEILFKQGGDIIGNKLTNINMQLLEKALKANPFIEHARVFADMNGLMHIDIKQRKPVLRIINK